MTIKMRRKIIDEKTQISSSMLDDLSFILSFMFCCIYMSAYTPTYVMEYLRETKGITQSLPNGLVREFFVIENI
jgi:hypothetical protein